VYCYERLNQIEEGSYGVVFRAKDKQTGDIVALKKLKLDEEKHGFPITALREVNALMSCRHDNVVGIREVVVGDTLTQYVSDIICSCSNNLIFSKSICCHGFH
jgi:cell division cycle 2-like protein